MRVSIIVPDNFVILEGRVVEVSNLTEHLPEEGIHAVQIFEDDTAEIEYVNTDRLNEAADASDFAAAIQAAQDEIARLDAPPPPLTHEQQQKAALQQLSALHSEWLNTSTGHASAEERDTWGVKAAAAKAWSSGDADTDQKAMLEAETTERGASVDDLVAVILANSASYHRLVGYARGALSVAEAAVSAATDQAGIDEALTEFQGKMQGYGSEEA